MESKKLLPIFYILIIGYLFFPKTVNASNLTLSGWDPGIYKQCAHSGNQPSLIRSYDTTYDCGNDGKYWLIGFHSENSYDPSGQCVSKFDLNDPNSPVKINWTKLVDGRWDVQLLTDFSKYAHPCGSNYFNWFMFLDQNSNQIYPTPKNLSTSYELWYDSFLPNGTAGGADRVIALWQGYWKDKNGKTKAREIEISLAMEGWSEGINSKVVAVLNNDSLNYVHINGLAYGITLPKQQSKEILIDWASIISDLVNNNYLDAPSDWNQTTTTSLGVGTETNNKTVNNSVITNIHIRNFKVLGALGDTNNDGHIDIIDLGIVIDNYGKSPIPNPKADLNSDGVVDIVDVGILIDNYGK